MQLGVDQLTGVHGGTVQKEAGLSPDSRTGNHIICQRGISGGILLLLVIIILIHRAPCQDPCSCGLIAR